MSRFSPTKLFGKNARLSYHDMILENAGLDAYWNFGAGAGNKTWDQKGTNHGDITGATWVQKSNGLWTLSFDGTNDLVSADGVSVTDYSAECWFKPDGVSGTKTIVEQGNFILRQVDDGIEYGFITDTGEEVIEIATSVLTTGSWIFIVITKESSSVKLYIDSALVDSFTDATTQNSERNLSMAVSDRNYFPYISLTPANLTSEKGILITREDNLQYSRGSKTQNNESIVYENVNSYQFGFEAWAKTNFASGDTNTHYVIDTDFLKLYWDGANTQWKAEVNGTSITKSDTFSSGDWIYLLVNCVSQSPTLDLEVDGSSASQVTSAQTVVTPNANIFIGQDSSNANIFDGVILWKLENNTFSSRYNSGSGHSDTVTVNPNTVGFGIYSDDDTDAVFQHRGQEVTAATEDDVTVNEAVGNRSFANGDRVVIYDGTGYKKETTLDGAPSGSNIPVTNTADLDKVGVYATLNGSTQYFDGGDVLDADTNDISVSAWIKTENNSRIEVIVNKLQYDAGTDIGYVFQTLSNGFLQFRIVNNLGWRAVEANSNLINDGKWHYVAAIVDRDNASGMTLYVDGYEVSSYAIQNDPTGIATSLDHNQPLRVGMPSDGYNDGFTGSIRDVRIYIAAGANWSAANILTQATTPLDNTAGGTNTSSWYLTDAAADTDITDDTGSNDLTLVGGTTTNYGTHSRTQSAFISKNLISDPGMENGGIGGWDATTDSAHIKTFEKSSIAKFDTQSFKLVSVGSGDPEIWQDIAIDADSNYLLRGWVKSSPQTAGFIIAISDITAGINFRDVSSGGDNWDLMESAFKTQSGISVLDTFELVIAVTAEDDTAYFDQLQLLPNLVDNGGCEVSDSGLAITNNETAGSDVVIEMADTGDLAVGDLVYFDGTGGGTTEWTTVKAFTLDTSITVDITTNKSAIDEVSGYTWNTEGSPATGEVIFASNDEHSGTLGLELVDADDGEGVTQDVTVVNGKWYTFSTWAKNDSQDIEILLSDATTKTIDTTNANAWTKYSWTFKAASTTLTIKLVSGAADQDGYFDDVAVIALDQIAPSTESRITEFCDSDLKDIAIFDSVLSLVDIQKHYQVGIWEGLDV